MLKKTIAVAALALLGTTSIQAELFKPEDAVQYRQAIYQIFSAQSSVMGGMVRGDIPFDAEEVHKRATNIAKVAPMLGETYFSATRGVSGSKLQDRAWNNMSDFQAKGQAFGKALGDLIEASAQPDFDQAKARQSIGALVQSCRSCHDDYRAR